MNEMKGSGRESLKEALEKVKLMLTDSKNSKSGPVSGKEKCQ